MDGEVKLIPDQILRIEVGDATPMTFDVESGTAKKGAFVHKEVYVWDGRLSSAGLPAFDLQTTGR